MREIKFRIWDIEVERFYYWEITETPPRCLTNRYIKEEAEQFTGILDKNGKEIYAGDIVRMDNGNEYVKEWHEIEDYDVGGMIGVGFSSYRNLSGDMVEEVIGNIHESA
jgi:hypothetical protein